MNNIREFLNKKVDEYNQPFFIADDPISVPHLFTKKQDIEIAGFFAALFAWGNRTTIIQKSKELLSFMDNSPHDFITNAPEQSLKRLIHFKHRTFNATDLLYFIEFLKHHYRNSNSLETAFTKGLDASDQDMGAALCSFHHYFFSLEDAPARTRKHIATPEKKSTCKRLNMYLRWMVRKDSAGVDFGIWPHISPSLLICPIDLHVARVAKRLNLLQRKQVDWQAALELTSFLRTLDKSDPAKYDFALFGLGVMEKY
jgi:uncharacterized protein (TIGR02757 family)